MPRFSEDVGAVMFGYHTEIEAAKRLKANKKIKRMTAKTKQALKGQPKDRKRNCDEN